MKKFFMKKMVDHAILPTQAEGDVGFDMYSAVNIELKKGKTTPISTGLMIADYKSFFISKNDYTETYIDYFPKLETRSSMAIKGLFTVGGIIDPTYRGELKVLIYNSNDFDYEVKAGDKIAQFILYTALATPEIEIEESLDVSNTERGSKGFGSTGKR